MIKTLAQDKISSAQMIFYLIYRDSVQGKKTYSICSFQKSGRTWLRFFLANYINIHYKLDMVVDVRSVIDIIPAYTYNKLIHYFNEIERIDSDIPLILVSHSAYKKYLFFKTPIIFIIRSVYDVIVSYYFHKSKHRSSFNGDISSFIKSEIYGVRHIVKYMNSWSKYLVNSGSLVVSYEDMQRDTNKTFVNIISFLNIDIDETALNLAIEQSSFDNMKRSEIDMGMQGHIYSVLDKNSRRMRSGIIGDYINHLDSEDIEYIRNYCDKYLNKDSKNIYISKGIEL